MKMKLFKLLPVLLASLAGTALAAPRRMWKIRLTPIKRGANFPG